jgi:hypothetical protein
MKRTGSPDGWVADLVSSKWSWNFNDPDATVAGKSSAADTSNNDGEENANREYLDVLFPWMMEINSIRLQGIR